MMQKYHYVLVKYVGMLYACHCVLLQKRCLYDVRPPLCTAINVLVWCRPITVYHYQKGYKQSVSKMLGRTSGVSTPQQNKRKKFILTYVHKQFSRYSPTVRWTQSCRLLSLRTLRTPSVFSCNWKWRHIHQHSFYACKTICSCSQTIERVLHTMIRCVYVHTDSHGGHLSICHLIWNVL